MNYRHWIYFLWLPLSLVGCGMTNLLSVSQKHLDKNLSLVPLKAWKINGQSNSDLAGNYNNAHRDYLNETFDLIQELDHLDLSSYDQKVNSTSLNHYQLKTTLTSIEPFTGILLLGAEAQVRVCNNEKSILPLSENGGFKKYGKQFKIDLIKGKNELVIELFYSQEQSDKRFLCAISHLKKAAMNHHFNFWNDYLVKSLYKQNDSLVFDAPFYGEEAVLNVTSLEHKLVVLSDTISTPRKQVSLYGLSPGSYLSELITNDLKYIQPFVIGDYQQIVSAVKSDTSITNHIDYKATIHPLIERYDYLQKYAPKIGQRKAYFSVESSKDLKKWKTIFKGNSISHQLKTDSLSLINNQARYVKISCKGNSINSWNSIAELRFLGTENSSLSTPKELVIREIHASSHEGDHYSSYVDDGDLSTCWQSNGEKEYILFDFGIAVEPSHLDIAWKKDIIDDQRVNHWKKSLSTTISEIVIGTQSAKNSSKIFERIPGRHLFDYSTHSEEKGKHYLAHIPDGIDSQERLPVILHILPRVITPVELHKSYLMSNTEDLDHSQWASNQLGAIDIWTFGGSYSAYLYDRDISEYRSLLRDVYRRFQIDSTRCYLYATCSGFGKALTLSEALPQKFAGIASCPMYYPSESANTMEKRLPNIKDIPIFITHAREDEITPIHGLETFLPVARTNNLSVEHHILEETSRAFYGSENYYPLYKKLIESKKKTSYPKTYLGDRLKYFPYAWLSIEIKNERENYEITEIQSADSLNLNLSNATVLTFNQKAFTKSFPSIKSLLVNGVPLSLEKRNSNTRNQKVESLMPNVISPMGKNPEIEGPINDFFSHTFKIIVSSAGNDSARTHQRKITNQFSRYWKKNYLSTPIILWDHELTKNEAASNHLLIIGNHSSELEIKKNKIPVEAFQQSLIGSKTASAIYVHPNPFNPTKYILRLDTKGIFNMTEKVFFNIVKCAFDYTLIRQMSNEGTVLSQGNFDHQWKLTDQLLP